MTEEGMYYVVMLWKEEQGHWEKKALYPKLNKGHVAKQELNPNLQSLESDPPDSN